MRTTEILPASLVFAGFSLATGVSRIFAACPKDQQDDLTNDLYKDITPAINTRVDELLDMVEVRVKHINGLSTRKEVEDYLETDGVIEGDLLSESLYNVIAESIQDFVEHSTLDTEMDIEKAVLMATILNNAVEHLSEVLNQKYKDLHRAVLLKMMMVDDTEDEVALVGDVQGEQEATDKPEEN